jgi:hypothetical protein
LQVVGDTDIKNGSGKIGENINRINWHSEIYIKNKRRSWMGVLFTHKKNSIG